MARPSPIAPIVIAAVVVSTVPVAVTIRAAVPVAVVAPVPVAVAAVPVAIVAIVAAVAADVVVGVALVVVVVVAPAVVTLISVAIPSGTRLLIPVLYGWRPEVASSLLRAVVLVANHAWRKADLAITTEATADTADAVARMASVHAAACSIGMAEFARSTCPGSGITVAIGVSTLIRCLPLEGGRD